MVPTLYLPLFSFILEKRGDFNPSKFDSHIPIGVEQEKYDSYLSSQRIGSLIVQKLPRAID